MTLTAAADCARCGDEDGVAIGAGEATVKGPSFAIAHSISVVLAAGAARGLSSVMQMRPLVAACSSITPTSCMGSKRISCSSIFRIRSSTFTPASSAGLEGDTPTTRHCVGTVSDVFTCSEQSQTATHNHAHAENGVPKHVGHYDRPFHLYVYLEAQRCIELFVHLDTDFFTAHGQAIEDPLWLVDRSTASLYIV